MKNPSVLQMQEPIYYNIEQVTFEVNNISRTTGRSRSRVIVAAL